MAGVVAAAGWLPAFRGRAAAIGGTVGLALLVAAAMRVGSLDEALYRGLFTLLALSAAAGVLAAVRAGPGRLTRGLALRPLVAAGVMSYSRGAGCHARRGRGRGVLPVRRASLPAPSRRPGVSVAVADPGPWTRQRSVAMAKQRSSRAPNAYSS